MKVLVWSVVVTLLVCIQQCYGTYPAEGYFVVDERAVRTYVNEIPGTDSYNSKRTQAVNNLRRDLDYLLYEVNQLLSTLNNNGLNIEVRVKGINFLGLDVFPGFYVQNGNSVNGGVALQLFRDYQIQQNSYNSIRYDFALLLTGYDIYGDSGALTTGLAYIGGICHPTLSVGVAELNATYITALTIARDVSHLVGANNDGAASDYVNALTNYASDINRWFFSSCSASQIGDYISILSPNCLVQTDANSARPTFSVSTYTGQILNKDVICQRAVNNPKSYACLSHNLYLNSPPKGDRICQLIYCSLPGTVYCTPVFPSEGQICDVNKRCDNGRCVPDSSQTSGYVNPNCVLGDQKRLESPAFPFNGTCTEFVNQRGRDICYNQIVTQVCCATCNARATGPAGCEYGDKNVQCSTLPKTTSCSPQNRAVCCGTCQGYVGKRSADLRDVLVQLKVEFTEDLPKNGTYQAKKIDIYEHVHID